MTEWRVTPEYINRHWTEELLSLMFVKRAVRFERQAVAAGLKEPDKKLLPPKIVSDKELFEMVGFTPDVIDASLKKVN